MPKDGFKSITIASGLYDHYKDIFQQNKKELQLKGIRSFSGYVSHILESKTEIDKIHAVYSPVMDVLSWPDDKQPTIIIRDNPKQIAVTLKIDSDLNILSCLHCQTTNCIHIGFAITQPKILRYINKIAGEIMNNE